MLTRTAFCATATFVALFLTGAGGAVWAQASPGASVAAASGAAAATVAGTVAGTVKRSLGSVTLEREGQLQPAQAGTLLRVGDVLRTGADGAAGITLADDSLLTAGPGSELVISAFAFNPITHEGTLLASLWRGTLAVVTGLIGKKAPEQVRVQTRTVVLGSRGTEFIVESSGVTR